MQATTGGRWIFTPGPEISGSTPRVIARSIAGRRDAIAMEPWLRWSANMADGTEDTRVFVGNRGMPRVWHLHRGHRGARRSGTSRGRTRAVHPGAPAVPCAPASADAPGTVALRDDFPWLADFITRTNDPDPVGRLERLRSEVEADPEDLGARHRLGGAHLELAVHGPAHEHDPLRHLKQAEQGYEGLVSDPALARDMHGDEAVFNRALIAMLGRDDLVFKENALRLIREYPQSTQTPYVYLAFAEDMLDRGDIRSAIKLLEKVIQHENVHAGAFALHDLGAAFMLSDPAEPRRALESYVGAIRRTQRPNQPFPSSATALRAATRRALVVPYAQVGDSRRAPAFFRRVGTGPNGEDMVDEMLARLRELQNPTSSGNSP